MQFHTWEDQWLKDDRWIYKLDDLRSQRLINAIGISLNRWEPWNGVQAVGLDKLILYRSFTTSSIRILKTTCFRRARK